MIVSATIEAGQIKLSSAMDFMTILLRRVPNCAALSVVGAPEKPERRPYGELSIFRFALAGEPDPKPPKPRST